MRRGARSEILGLYRVGVPERNRQDKDMNNEEGKLFLRFSRTSSCGCFTTPILSATTNTKAMAPD